MDEDEGEGGDQQEEDEMAPQSAPMQLPLPPRPSHLLDLIRAQLDVSLNAEGLAARIMADFGAPPVIPAELQQYKSVPKSYT